MDKTKFPGVRAIKFRFEARIKDGSVRRSIGVFDTAEEAFAAYEAARAKAKANNPPWRTRKLTAERLRQIISYNPNTGNFTRIARAGVKGGIDGGNIHPRNGYRYIRVDGHKYLAHRIAWLYMTGTFPAASLDHKDGNRANNQFNNLRPATYADNSQNRPAVSKNISGLRGVFWHTRSKKFCARITKDGRKYSLGYFRDPKEAHAAYLDAKRQLHTFQPEPRDL